MADTLASKAGDRKVMWVRLPPSAPMPLRPVTFDEQDLKKLFTSNTPTARFWRFLKRAVRTSLWFGVIVLTGFALLNGPAYWQRASFATNGTPINRSVIETPTSAPTINYDPEIVIPKIGVRAPVIYDVAFNSIIDNLHNGVVRYEGTANPGQVGNVVIVGHSSDFPWSTGRYKTIFSLLDKLTSGDEIILPYGTDRYVYKITETKVVKPTDLSVLARTPTATITLITCYPVGTTLNRLIVRANLVAGPVGPPQTTEPFLGQSLTAAR